MNFKKIINIINPQPILAGLEISDLELRFIKLKRDNLISVSVKLAPGIIEEGKIKNRPNFIAALSSLHSKITSKKKKKIYVIVSIPSVNVYAKTFNLPSIASNNIEEAANLNLQMISPINFADTYSDWQLVNENKRYDGQVEILGALAPSSVIKEFSSSLEEAGFGIGAIEFSALSLARLAIDLGVGVDVKSPEILLQISSEGLNFSAIRNGNLYFTHFNYWKTVSNFKETGKIPFLDFKEFLIKETQKILHFYESHWEGKINKVILVSQGLNNEIVKIFSENLSLKIQLLTLKKFNQLSPVWYCALSLALRGLIPRSQDNIISLTDTGTKEKFQQHQVINFINIWRNIILISLVFIIMVFGATTWFLADKMEFINVPRVDLLGAMKIEELDQLNKEVVDFNKKVKLTLEAKQSSINLFPIFEKIKNLAGDDITLERIFIQSLETPILINATAVNREAVINFRDALEQQAQFYQINLPLLNIVSLVDGPIKFSVSFKVKF